jgi:Zn-dependent protease with chaperone function
VRYLLAVALVAAMSCSLLSRAEPTVPPLISAAFLSVHLLAGEASDAEERSRLPALRDTIAGALPAAWVSATFGRGRLALRTDADIEVKLEGTTGTSALTQHKRNGKVVSRTIAIHTLESNRRLSPSELLTVMLHELGHIWCCYGEGTVDGHWADTATGFSPVGLMSSPMRCQGTPGNEPECPSVFSDRELKEMGLTAP